MKPVTIALSAVLGITACAMGGGKDPLPGERGSIQLTSACPGLATLIVPASAIGLPSGLARVTDAGFVPAQPQAVTGNSTRPATPDFCKVLGTIAPVDPAAQLIHFQVNLPIAWNGKALQYGGGGYNGTLVTGLTPLRDANPDDPLPLARGYVTLGTDSGHQASAFAPNAIGQFGLNDEMLANYGYASYKKVKDVAVQVTRAFYGRAPSKMYYFGGSEGGREGLTMAQRFPRDYDGIVSVVPVVQLSLLFQSYIPHTRPQFAGGWMNAAKIQALASFVANACDGLDGLADGVINNYMACPARINLEQLRCTGGADTGNSCLSDAQLAVVRSMHSPYTLPFPVANGISSYPAWTFYGNETTPDPVIATWGRWVTGASAPTPEVDAAAAQHWLYGANFVRYFATRDPGFDVRNFDPAKHQARLQQVSEIIDSSHPDLRAFFSRGGRLILRENTADVAQSAQAGIDYFNAVRNRVGATLADSSARLYVSPGSTHTGHGASVTDGAPIATMVDLLDPLDRWVTTGQAPANALTQTVKTATPPFTQLASRPMCRYPAYPRYVGGDSKQASSYTCTLSTQ
jgi:feruloyl esterase